jgi:hypothetical protein
VSDGPEISDGRMELRKDVLPRERASPQNTQERALLVSTSSQCGVMLGGR